MAYQPGWTRDRLRYAESADIEAARWIEFARALSPAVSADIEGQIEQLKFDELEGRARERAARSIRAKERERLGRVLKEQANLRKLLLLDEDDDAE